MRAIISGFAAVIACTLLAACSTLSPSQMQGATVVVRAAAASVEMQGRLSVSDGAHAAHLRVYWHRRPGEDLISFDTPLGQTLAQLRVTPDSAVLQEADGRRTVAATADELAARVVGAAIPVSRLADWLQAVVGAGATVQRRDDRGRIALLAEDGWLIAYPEYASPVSAAMPRRIEAERGDVSVRVVIDEWSPE